MQATDETLDLIRRYYAVVDSGVLDDCERFFTSDATLRIAHHPEIVGADAIARLMRAGVGDPRVEGIRHEVKSAWQEDDGVVIFEVEANYSLADGRTVIVPGVVIAEIDDGRFRSQRIAADLSVVYGAS